MRKLMIATFVAAAAVASLFGASRVEAQEYPSVEGLTPFTQGANFMSLPGYLRWKHFQATGQWIGRDEAVQAVNNGGGGAAVDADADVDADAATDADAGVDADMDADGDM